MNKKYVNLFMLICCLFLSVACSIADQSAFGEEVEAAIDNGSITRDMIKTSYLSETQLKYLTQKLTQFQNDNDVEKALALLYAAPEGDGIGHTSFLDGQKAYASDGFINWVKNAVLDKDKGTEDYEFEWDASRALNQFDFKKKDSDVQMTVLSYNSFYKTSSKQYMAGLNQPSESVERDYSSIHSSSASSSTNDTDSSSTYSSSSSSSSNSKDDDTSNSSNSSGWGKCTSCHQKEATHGVYCDECYYEELMNLNEHGISPQELEMWENGYGWYDDKYYVGD